MQNNLTQILEVAKPKIDSMVQNFIEANLRPNKNGIVRPATKYDIEMYELGITIDLIKAFGRYIKQTDTVEDVTIGSQKGVIVIYCNVIRDGVKNFLETEMIIAGGYNIQVRHYRYITKTKLYSNEYNEAAAELIAKRNKLSKTEKIKEEIKYNDNWFERRMKEFNDLKALTKEFFIEKSKYFEYNGRRNEISWENLCEAAQKSYETKEKFDTEKLADVEKIWSEHLIRTSDKALKNIVKEYEKKNNKLLDKINSL